MAATFIPEFSRDFHLDKGLSGPTAFKIKATEAECAALAIRLNLLEIKEFSVEFTIEPSRQANEYEVRGSGHADINQACIVSLKDVPASVDFSFHTKLVEGVEKPIDEGDFSFLEDETDTDYYQDSHIDLGEIATQYLSLFLNPYPKAEGVEEEHMYDTDEDEPVRDTSLAFALLGKLKDVKS